MGHLAAAGASYLGEAFVFTIETTAPGDSFYPGLSSTGIYNFYIDWGDSSNDTITAYNQAEATHVYAAPGTYTITIKGSLSKWNISNLNASPYASRYKSVLSWGPDGTIDSLSSGFFNAFNLTSIPNGPLPSSITTIRNCFANTSLAAVPSNLLDGLTSVTDCRNAFENSDIVTVPDAFGMDSLVENVSAMFSGCSSLLSIGANVFKNSKVGSAGSMFTPCAGLTTIGDDFMRFSDFTHVDKSFMFATNSNLTTVGANFMSDCIGTALVNTGYIFNNCSGLSSVGLNSFNNGDFVTFNSAFRGCSSLVTLPTIEGVNPNTDFQLCFFDCINAVNSPQELWVDYPGASSSINCYGNCTSLTNYASIPASWK